MMMSMTNHNDSQGRTVDEGGDEVKKRAERKSKKKIVVGARNVKPTFVPISS